MTATELYTSLKSLYKNMMFPMSEFLPDGRIIEKRKWTLSEIDQVDVHFFYELMDTKEQTPKEKDVYLGDVW